MQTTAPRDQGLEIEMTTIQIAYDVPAATVDKINTFLEEILATDVNWNGAVFEIERSDFTCINECDEYNGTKLLHQIFNIIDGK